MTPEHEELLTREYAWLLLHFVTHERETGEVCRICDGAYIVLMDEDLDGGHVGPIHVSQEERQRLAVLVTGWVVRQDGRQGVNKLLRLLHDREEFTAVALFVEPLT